MCNDDAIAYLDEAQPQRLSDMSEPARTTQAIERATFDVLLDTTREHLLIADAEGRIRAASDSCAAVYGTTPAALRDSDVDTLEAAGVFNPSITRRVLDSGRVERVVQTTQTGREVLAEAYPVFVDGRLVRVISRSRDMTDLRHLHEEYVTILRQLADTPRADRQAGAAAWADIAAGPAMHESMTLIARAAPTDATLLLLGESGVGKTALARRVHAASPRANEPLVEINCGAIPATLFESEMFGAAPGAYTGAPRDGRSGYLEQADGGTLFLDEIAELPLSLQPKLLGVLQSGTFTRLGDEHPRRVNIRVIAASNRDLAGCVARGEFRRDLFYRLSVVPVTVPTLRARRAEIPALVESIMARLAERYGEARVLDGRAWGYVMSHDWPGNVRELENYLERQWLVGHEAPDADPQDSEGALTGAAQKRSLSAALAATERACLLQALEHCNSTYAVARWLGISQAGVVRKLRRHGLRPPARTGRRPAARG